MGRPEKRSPNLLFVIFRSTLSIAMLGLLLIGIYSAYKHFSGLDPLKLDPKSIFTSVLSSKDIEKLTNSMPFLNLGTFLQSSKQTSTAMIENSENKDQKQTYGKLLFKFMLFADSHSDNENLKKAITLSKKDYPDIAFMIGLGDYTEVGTVSELRSAKSVLDQAGIRYFLVPGDHDLWDSRDKGKDPLDNYTQVFGSSYQTFIFKNIKFILLDNSDNYKGLSDKQQEFITAELEKIKSENVLGILVFIHEPLFHPSSDRFMGKVEKEVKVQAEGLIYQLKTAQVKKVFSGDIHYFSQYDEPVTKLSMTTIGALAKERNPQNPRFAIVSVYDSGSIAVEDLEIK